ncbi:MAG TPA: hypothetical protein DCO75_05380 [Fibrobacteres bacterium]|nr:hypothetical protein [Fibrobacterota bacterium]
MFDVFRYGHLFNLYYIILSVYTNVILPIGVFCAIRYIIYNLRLDVLFPDSKNHCTPVVDQDGS